MTIAGVTRFGKTVFLKVLMTYLISNHPDDCEFYVIDLKGGLEFSQYAELPQVKGVAGNYIEAFMMAFYLHNLLEQDLKFFKAHGIRNIVDSKIKRRRFIIVDEAAQLAAEKFMTQKVKDIPEIEPFLKLLPKNVQTGSQRDMMNYTQYLLSEVARLGGALGYRLIYCTQYPTADTLPRQIKMNSDAKLTYRLPTGYASEVAIDAKGAEELPSGIKGRALYKTHDLTEMQTPLLEDKEMWKILSKFRVSRLKGEQKNGNGKNTNNRKTGRNFEYTGPPSVRDTGTAANYPSVRDE
jgi:S-DNA-T family DNA segregation ATPase FtsK/SpoIIIE